MIAEASTVADGVTLAKRYQPDAVVIDLSFPEGGAIGAIDLLRRECPETGIVVLTVHNTRECLEAAMEAGAHGFVAKDASFEALLESLRGAIAWRENAATSLPSAVLRGALATRQRAAFLLNGSISSPGSRPNIPAARRAP